MAGDPSLTQLRAGFEATNNGLGDSANVIDSRLLSEGVGADFPTIPDDSIAPAGEEEQGLESKITPGGPINVNWMAEDHAKFLAAFFGNGATPVETPASSGRFLHRLAPTESDLSFGRLAVEISRDLGRPTLYTGVEVASLTFNTGPRSLLNGAVELIFPRFHYWDDPTQTTGSSTDPFTRGLYDFAELELATADLGDLFVTVDAVPGTGGADFNVKAKIGTATTYDGAAIPVFVGLDADGKPRFTVLKHTATDVHVGQNDELPVEVHWADLTGVAALDEWRIPRRRVVWSQTLQPKAVFNEIATTVKVDDLTRRINNVSLTTNRLIVLDEVIGGRFTDDTVPGGNREAFGQLDRRALGLELTNRLLAAETFQLRIEAKSTEVGASGERRRLDLIALNCVPSGRTPSVGGRDTFQEAFPFRCHPSDDVTYPASLTAELFSSQATLA